MFLYINAYINDQVFHGKYFMGNKDSKFEFILKKKKKRLEGINNGLSNK